MQQLHAECRFYLKQLHPIFELYVSPLNLDPMAPALPISTPAAYAADSRARPAGSTRRACPRTRRASRPACSRGEFLQQARLARRRESAPVSATCSDHFDGRVALPLLRQRRSGLAHDVAVDGPAASGLRRRDRRAVSRTSSTSSTWSWTPSSARRSTRLGPDDLLVVMSDHGFASWRRAFNLNSWLRDNGYLTSWLAIRAGAARPRSTTSTGRARARTASG